MFQNLYDSHIHSVNSPDADDTVEMICQSASESGFSGIAITDHCEINEFVKKNYENRVALSFADAMKAKDDFDGKLTVSAGVELANPLENLGYTELILKSHKFDFIIGSVHNIFGKPDFYYGQWKNASQKELDDSFSEYLDHVRRTVILNNFDTLAHLTYPLRYLVSDSGNRIHTNDHLDEIDVILRLLAQNGKALEINTSGLRHPIGVTLPTVDIVKRFRALGGEMLTIGSDSHRAEYVGNGIERGMELAREAGFEYVAFFKERKPEFIKIF